MRKSLIMGGITLAATAALVAGCGGNDDMSGMQHDSAATTTTAAAAGRQADHTEQDVTFAQEMIAHHSQALDMVRLAPSRSTNQKVLDLAGRIEKAQDPEIQQMRGWLTSWGMAGTTTSSMAGMSGMPGTAMSMPGMTGGSMPGMMTDADMAKLEQVKGTEFDQMFLQMMIQHHSGAIEMAKTELAQGGNADAKALAQKIIDAQQAEITEMRALLSQG